MRAMITGRDRNDTGRAHEHNFSRRKADLHRTRSRGGRVGSGRGSELAQKYGLVPPDHGGIYGLGETLTYASQRLLTRHSFAREFSRSQISKRPFANEIAPPSDDFKRLQAGGFADWRLTVDGLVDRPASFSLDQLKSYPSRSQITELACEEGWSYVAEWIGVPLSHVLNARGSPSASAIRGLFLDRARLVGEHRHGRRLHPQTFLTYGDEWRRCFRWAFGGPLRLRVPRQLGYKSVKFITHLTVTDSMKKFGKGLGSASPEGGYAWYAGI